MISYSKSAFISDINKKDVLFFDVNAQGILELSPSGKILKNNFPETYKLYIRACHDGELKGGDLLPFFENGYSIILGVMTENITPKLKSSAKDTELFVDIVAEGLQDFLLDNDELKMPIPLRYKTTSEFIGYFNSALMQSITNKITMYGS